MCVYERTVHTYVYICIRIYVRTYLTVSACVPLCVGQSAATKAIVEAQLIRRLGQRPTKGELEDRDIRKVRCNSAYLSIYIYTYIHTVCKQTNEHTR